MGWRGGRLSVSPEVELKTLMLPLNTVHGLKKSERPTVSLMIPRLEAAEQEFKHPALNIEPGLCPKLLSRCWGQGGGSGQGHKFQLKPECQSQLCRPMAVWPGACTEPLASCLPGCHRKRQREGKQLGQGHVGSVRFGDLNLQAVRTTESQL